MLKKTAASSSWHSMCMLLHKQSELWLSKTSSFSPRRSSRRYAMVSGGHSKYDHGNIRWPEVTSIDRVPTPYQIFGQKKGSPYSKQRFYELVKQYHPDRHDFNNSGDGLPHSVMLERYRLVVAANEILSDPIKRSAFDRYGAGWNGMPGVRSPRDMSNSATSWNDRSGRGWRDPDGPSQNATWEDWEKWYGRDKEQKQETQFVSNGAFFGLVIMFAILGGVGQATRAGNYGLTFVEQRDALHKSLSKDLQQRRQETTSLWNNREERVNNFLRQRSHVGYDGALSTDGDHRKLLAPPEICSSGDTQKRPMDLSKHLQNSNDG